MQHFGNDLPSLNKTTTTSAESEQQNPGDQGGPDPEARGKQTTISCSRGLVGWLASQRLSLAFSSYQSGQLFFVGVLPNGSLSFHQSDFVRAMGIWSDGARLVLGGARQIWRLENILRNNERANQHFDRLFVPRNAHFVGDLDIHELTVQQSGRVVFVNTKYSCLSTTSDTHSFKPLWKPAFISQLVPEDRCHLNGLATENDIVRYVTCVGSSDVVDGWRDHRRDGGMIIDVDTNEPLIQGLSMPHSPRMAGGQLWFLNSGTGYLCRADRKSGAMEPVAFCPGFLRGLEIVGHYAVITLSLPRKGRFDGLELQETLKSRGATPWCGIVIVDLRDGGIVYWLRLEGEVKELFDVTLLKGVTCPLALDLKSDELSNLITYDQEFGSLN